MFYPKDFFSDPIYINRDAVVHSYFIEIKKLLDSKVFSKMHSVIYIEETEKLKEIFGSLNRYQIEVLLNTFYKCGWNFRKYKNWNNTGKAAIFLMAK